METMINLNDLLKHEILDLYSVEEQIIDAMPAMIEKAKNPELKKALREHLKITEEQKSRLDKVKASMGEGDGEGNGENKGFFSRLFGGGGEKCKGMAGIISEGEKIMSADITDEALDAAIIASAQKIEHYEICGYGTARAFARELKLMEVEKLLTQTLNEEYMADDLLTTLAVGKLNVEAEFADGINGNAGRYKRTNGSNSNGSNKSSGGPSKNSASKSVSKSSGGKNSASKGSSKSSSKSGNSKVASKSSSKGSSKGSKTVSKSSSKAGAAKAKAKSSSRGGKAGSKSGSKKVGSRKR